MDLRIVGCAALLILLAGTVAADLALSPTEDAVAGDVITIAGTTSFSPEHRVHVEVQPLSFAPTSKTEPGMASGYAATTGIVEEEGAWRWSVAVDTSSFAPGEYLVTAGVVGTDATATAHFTLRPAAAETTDPGTPPSPEATPSSTVTGTAAPEETAVPGVGRDPVACVAGLIAALAVAGLRLKK